MRASVAGVPADRHPESPRISAELPTQRLDDPIEDGDAFSGAEVAASRSPTAG